MFVGTLPYLGVLVLYRRLEVSITVLSMVGALLMWARYLRKGATLARTVPASVALVLVRPETGMLAIAAPLLAAGVARGVAPSPTTTRSDARSRSARVSVAVVASIAPFHWRTRATVPPSRSRARLWGSASTAASPTRALHLLRRPNSSPRAGSRAAAGAGGIPTRQLTDPLASSRWRCPSLSAGLDPAGACSFPAWPLVAVLAGATVSKRTAAKLHPGDCVWCARILVLVGSRRHGGAVVAITH